MLHRKRAPRRRMSRWLVAVAICAIALACAFGAQAGFVDSSAVGGISIDGMGALAMPTVDEQRQLLTARETALEEIPGDLAQFTPMRMVSLKQLDEAVRKHRIESPLPLPQELQFVAGLQRIEYVFVYPDQHDIVIAGPAEGWEIDDLGNVVGVTTRRPVLALDDLIVALRGADETNGDGIFCSIDPTPEGVAQLNSFLAAQRTIGNPQQTIRAIEQALGPQKITVGGVSATTHFARVLVAADFRMKRIAMGFDPSPVKDLPSYLQMVSAGSVGRGPQSAMPRWWLEAKYEPVSTDGDGLAWRLKPAAVECLTENDFVAADGTRRTSDKANPQAQKWAATMTKNYDELAKADSTFGQLRSIMDLAVVAALIKKEGLVGFANLEIPTLMGSEYVQYFNAPKEVASIASFIRKGNNWIISASGGVKFQPWQMADNTKQDKSVLTEREKISTQVGSARWWWN